MVSSQYILPTITLSCKPVNSMHIRIPQRTSPLLCFQLTLGFPTGVDSALRQVYGNVRRHWVVMHRGEGVIGTSPREDVAECPTVHRAAPASKA